MLTVKADHVISSEHRLSALFNRNFRSRYNSGSPRWGKPPGTPTGVFQNQNTPGTMGRLAWDFSARPNLLGRAALGYNRFGNMNESSYIDQDWPAKVGILNVPGTTFPVLNFAGQPYQGGGIGAGGRLGSGNAGGSYNGSTIGQVDMTYVHGKHNIKFGTENRFYYYNVRSKSGSGTFNFSPNQTAEPGFTNQTGHSFASFLLGAYASSSRGVDPSNFGYRWRDYGFYVQDDWKVSRKLTLNVGLRWEVIGRLYEVASRISFIDFAKPNPAAGNRPGALGVRRRVGPARPWGALLRAVRSEARLRLRRQQQAGAARRIRNQQHAADLQRFWLRRNAGLQRLHQPELGEYSDPLHGRRSGLHPEPVPEFHRSASEQEHHARQRAERHVLQRHLQPHAVCAELELRLPVSAPGVERGRSQLCRKQGDASDGQRVHRSERAAVHDYATVWRSAAASVEPVQPDSAAVPGLHRDQSAGAASVSAVHRNFGPVPQRRQFQTTTRSRCR